MKNNFTKATIIALVTFFSFGASATPVISTTTITTTYSTDYCGVTDQMIIEYMRSFNINVSVITPVTGTCNIYVKDVTSKRYIIFVNNGQIVGHEDLP